MFFYHSPLKPHNYEYPLLVVNYSMEGIVSLLLFGGLIYIYTLIEKDFESRGMESNGWMMGLIGIALLFIMVMAVMYMFD